MINLIQNIDMSILNAIKNYCHNPCLDKIMPFITSLGNLGIVWIIIAVLFIISKKYRKEGIMVLAALLLATILGEGIIKHLVQRPRPCANVPAVNLLVSKPLSYSFPSGHTSASFAAAGIIGSQIKKYRVYAFVLAAFIGFSRLYLFVHYPSDVAAGVILGLTCSYVVQKFFKKYKMKNV